MYHFMTPPSTSDLLLLLTGHWKFIKTKPKTKHDFYSHSKNHQVTIIGLPLKSKWNKLLPSVNRMRAEFMSKPRWCLFQRNCASQTTAVTPAHSDANSRARQALLVFPWKADDTVQEKHSHKNHLHINKLLWSLNLEKIILKCENILSCMAIKWHTPMCFQLLLNLGHQQPRKTKQVVLSGGHTCCGSWISVFKTEHLRMEIPENVRADCKQAPHASLGAEPQFLFRIL